MHLTIATHYCGGELSASKVSFSGKLATCGMEGEADQQSTSGIHLEKHCCDNRVTTFAVDHNYSPSFTDFHSFAEHILQVFIVPESTSIHSYTAINLNSTDTSPPRNLLVHGVSLPNICVFLI
jgi:hypothetical protein